MEAKEKAVELVDKFKDELIYSSLAKQCALIAVDEIITQFKKLGIPVIYWQEVRTEIEKF